MFAAGETRYQRNQILEVVCQVRFPTILTIDSRPPAEFQEAIREEFPKFAVRKEPAGPAREKEPAGELNNYYFSAEDDSWRVNLTRDFLALTCRRYDRWDGFAKKLDKVLAAFIQVYRPAYFQRIGLRYLNGFSRRELGLEGALWKELIQPAYLGLLGRDGAEERGVAVCMQNLETTIDGGCRLKLHCGPGKIQRGGKMEAEVRYILDLDVSMDGKILCNQAAPALSTVHGNAETVFESALEPALRQALLPEQG